MPPNEFSLYEAARTEEKFQLALTQHTQADSLPKTGPKRPSVKGSRTFLFI